ncbi:hypothetical protein MNBD_GAMMA11-2955 [hydrothermal vent metagenome]|uniref:J domain-containing protein n=1 Tax=hydrothermal vent metagenome TaxID=652676 RepID=A0A3B0WRP8_9ZZZZ
MQRTYTYEACYKILGVRPDCSWNELRHAYKKLIHDWHPDRLSDKSDAKEIADEKIKHINVAYHQLQRYYRKNNILPIVEAPRKPVTRPATEPEQPTRSEQPKESPVKAAKSGVKAQASSRQAETQAREVQARAGFKTMPPFRAFVYLSMVVLFALISLYLVDTRTINLETQEIGIGGLQLPDYSHPHEPLGEAPSWAHPDDLPLPRQNSTASAESKEEQEQTFFSDGDSISDVIEAQGVPDRTAGDIWYYGESEVHFKRGRVTHWVRTAESPLNARMRIRPH